MGVFGGDGCGCECVVSTYACLLVSLDIYLSGPVMLSSLQVPKL